MNDDEDVICDCCNHNGCIYFHRIWFDDENNKFYFDIGVRTPSEVKLLCAVKQAYDDVEIAEIAANAFISGMVYMNRLTPSTLN